jgi:hypothetical protein
VNAAAAVTQEATNVQVRWKQPTKKWEESTFFGVLDRGVAVGDQYNGPTLSRK